MQTPCCDAECMATMNVVEFSVHEPWQLYTARTECNANMISHFCFGLAHCVCIVGGGGGRKLSPAVRLIGGTITFVSIIVTMRLHFNHVRLRAADQ